MAVSFPGCRMARPQQQVAIRSHRTSSSNWGCELNTCQKTQNSNENYAPCLEPACLPPRFRLSRPASILPTLPSIHLMPMLKVVTPEAVRVAIPVVGKEVIRAPVRETLAKAETLEKAAIPVRAPAASLAKEKAKGEGNLPADRYPPVSVTSSIRAGQVGEWKCSTRTVGARASAVPGII